MDRRYFISGSGFTRDSLVYVPLSNGVADPVPPRGRGPTKKQPQTGFLDQENSDCGRPESSRKSPPENCANPRGSAKTLYRQAGCSLCVMQGESFTRIIWFCRIILDDNYRRRVYAARSASWLTQETCPRDTRLGQRHDPGDPQPQYTNRDEGDQPDLQRPFRTARPFDPTLFPPAVPHRRRLVLVYGRPPRA